ncbi:molecular chaperone DnaK [Streptomyces armeniacus]|uniref:Molecular chaperone DnaK n=1 Tax=Streptomyces armeniacus TaxID=83291 RepID=A0A345XLC5_9ACTN|nr:TraR/DksA C4-type zinc finger protein [Streptomyces armeniacus]AXK32441.1 molecular chaperone DnaK [Streptomyces armeniacus]
MTPDTSPSRPAAGRLTAHEAGQHLEHERNARLTQLRVIEEAGQDGTDELLAAQKASTQRVLKEIEAAFARLADGSYGTCQDCRKPIPAERLEILPYARHCVPCQRQTT